MAVQVPFLSKSTIERDAEALIAEFEYARKSRITAPIPIDEIVELHLKLTLEFDDAHRMFDIPRASPNDTDILGAIFFDDGRIVIDETLDPYENPYREGRYRFTLAHEGGGHWRLHRKLFERSKAQASLFDQTSAPSVICRSSEAKKPIEWQADYYASCLLMPRTLVDDAWKEQFVDCRPRLLKPDEHVDHPFVEINRVHARFGDYDMSETAENAMEQFCKPLAERFGVSPIAMRIRLEELGLLLRSIPDQHLLATA